MVVRHGLSVDLGNSGVDPPDDLWKQRRIRYFVLQFNMSFDKYSTHTTFSPEVLLEQDSMHVLLTVISGSLALAPAFAQVAPVVSPIGVSASSFNIDEVSLTSSRFMDNQNRTLNYIKSIDIDRLLYVSLLPVCVRFKLSNNNIRFSARTTSCPLMVRYRARDGTHPTFLSAAISKDISSRPGRSATHS